MSDPRPLGIFDSGVGGLTVVRAVIDLLPREPVIYFGDTARSPYGPRALGEIRTFAREIAAFLLSRDVKVLVVACNSIEVAAIRDLTEEADVPVMGVIESGVRAALRATRTGRIGVIGTEATIATGEYERALRDADGGVELISQACPAFVPHVERGDTTSDELLTISREYLSPLRDAGVDALILGCTHYPLLSGLISHVMGPEVALVSSAEEAARDLYGLLLREGLLRDEDGAPRHEFLCSGDAASFKDLGGRFLGPEVSDVRPVEVRPAELRSPR
ncbi:MAG: glutamate racemase [Actinomycetota bacterium]